MNEQNKAIITSLGHSAFLVQTENYYLFFDYVSKTSGHGYVIEEQPIDFNDYQDKNIIMLYSHNHFDHYNKELHIFTQQYNNIFSVLGDIESKLEKTLTMKPREIKDIKGLTIYTTASTDIGVSYLVDVDNLIIFHSGDNAAWSKNNEKNKIYYDEIDYLYSLNRKIDIAFIPVCNFYNERPINLTEGAIYAINKLNPAVIFPMHSPYEEKVYNDFEKDMISRNINNKIIPLELNQTTEFK